MLGGTEIFFAIIIPIIYLVVVGFTFWMIFRFVKSFESMAESLKKIAEKEK